MASASAPEPEVFVEGGAIDWSSGSPCANRDLEEGTVVFTEMPEACVALMPMKPDHPGLRFFPDDVEYMDTTSCEDQGVFNAHAYLCRALLKAEYTDQNVRLSYELSPVRGDGITEVGRAVLLNERAMIDPWSGVAYGMAICKEISKFGHHCRPNCIILFGEKGRAFVFTHTEVKKGDPLTVSIIRHSHGDTLCACQRDNLLYRRFADSCRCSACVEDLGTRDDDNNSSSTPRCTRGSCTPQLHSVLLEGTTGEARTKAVQQWVHVMKPMDGLDHISKAQEIAVELMDLILERPDFWTSSPYLVSRIAHKLALLGDCYHGKLLDRRADARRMMALLIDAIDSAQPRTILSSAGLFRTIMSPDPETPPKIAMPELSRNVADAVESIDRLYPWMGPGGSLKYMPWLAARQPKAVDNLRSVWKASLGDRAGLDNLFKFSAHLKPDMVRLRQQLETMDPVELRTYLPVEYHDKAEVRAMLEGHPGGIEWAIGAIISEVEKRFSTAPETASASATTSATAPQPRKTMDDSGRCGHCSVEGPKHTCGRCSVTKYCSADCQRQDWPGHKAVCKPRPELAPPLQAAEPASPEIMQQWATWPLRQLLLANSPVVRRGFVHDAIQGTAKKMDLEDAFDREQMDDAASAMMASLKFMNPICGHATCGKTARTEMRACMGCANVFYCSEEHAKLHWRNGHHKICGLGSSR